MKLEDLTKVIDECSRLEVYDARGNLIHNDIPAKVKLEDRLKKVLSIVPQGTSRENFLEITVY